jgi:hypothetical protein
MYLDTCVYRQKWLYCISTGSEKARMPAPKQKELLTPVKARTHYAGGETSAGRPGITWMMFLVVFYCVSENFDDYLSRL